MQLSPLHKAKKRFGGQGDNDRTLARKAAKDELIGAVKAFVTKGDLLGDDFSDKGIQRVSNKKLIKLLDLAEKVQTETGSRQALIEAILDLEGRSRDQGYRERLESFRLPRLYDQYTAARKRT